MSDIYAAFKTNLLSGALRRTFFRETYLPSLPADERNEVEVRAYVIERQIDALCTKAEDQWEDRIVGLREALVVAGSDTMIGWRPVTERISRSLLYRSKRS